MTVRRQAVSWQTWSLWAAVSFVLVVELLTPTVPLAGFLVIPVVASALLGRPVLTGSLAVVSLIFAIPLQWWLDFPTSGIVIRSALIAAAGAVGCALAITMARAARNRAAALAEAHNSEALLRTVTDAMLDPQILFEPVRDGSGQITDFSYADVNRAACAHLGMRREDLIGHSLVQTFPNIEASGLLDRYVRCAQTGEPVELDDFPFFNGVLGGELRYDIRGARTPQGRLSMSYRDVTDRFEARRRLADSEARYRLLADNAADVVVHIRDGNVVWTSPSVSGLLGAPAEYWIGRPVTDVISPEDQPEFAERQALLRAGNTVRQRVRVRSVDGAIHWVDLHSSPFHDSAGNLDGSISALRPIDQEVAAERQAEQARRGEAAANELYRRSMDNAAIGTCLIDPDGRFVEVNPALCEFFGYDADTLKTRTWQQLTAPAFLEADLGKVDDVLNGRLDSYRMLKQYIHADGHPIWGDLSVSCVRDQAGRVERFVSQIVDVTATVEANERNRELNRLLDNELRSAATYIASIMPEGLSGEVTVTSKYLPSRELGGDCFDYYWFDDDHLIVYLIDVSGHGIEPALLAVSVQNMLRAGNLRDETLLDPAGILTELNRLFPMEKQNHHFFTVWYGVYDRTTRTLRYASAGAPPAYAFTTESPGAVAELSTRSAPVGAFEDTRFSTATYAVPPGCRILIYSDGASEITLAGGDQLSQDGFRDLTARLTDTPGATLDDILGRLRELTADGAFEDDLSLIQIAFD